MVLHPTQKIVAVDDHVYRVVDCGRQWGKTTLAVEEIKACAWSKSGRRIIYFATTFDQARNIAWTQLKESTQAIWIGEPNESRLELKVKTQDGGISEIFLKGFENIETARGQQFDLIVVDEVASMRNWDYAWNAILEPTLAIRQGKALFISTPRGFNHFHQMYLLGQDPNNLYWKSWRYTSYDNPYFPKERIEQAKTTSTEDYFAQEYLADFRKYTGLVYKEFDRGVHVVEGFSVPDDWSIYRCLDFGSTNPTACLWVAVDNDDNWFVCDEHYETGQTIDYHAGVINSKSQRSILATYGDPSGAQWISEFAQRGIYITPATKETGQNQEGWVRFGIEKVAERLKVVPGHTTAIPLTTPSPREILGMPKLFIFSTCTNTIREFETYRWQEKSVNRAQDLNEPDKVEKANDHACFTKDTKIEVPNGKIIYSRCTGKKKVYRFMGSKVTSDHPYLTPRGFITLDSLRYSDRIVVWKKGLLTELSLDDTQTPHTPSLQSIFYLLQRNYSTIKQNLCIGIYGKNIMGKYPKAFTSIIKTTIQIIMIYLISNAYHPKTIIQDTMMKCFLNGKKTLQKKQDRKPSHGINQKKPRHFIKELLKICGKIKNGCQKYVWSVTKNIKHHSQHEVNTAPLIAELPHLGEEKVYAHVSSNGFFLANGVIVSNCDALRYFAVSYKKTSNEWDNINQGLGRKWSL